MAEYFDFPESPVLSSTPIDMRRTEVQPIASSSFISTQASKLSFMDLVRTLRHYLYCECELDSRIQDLPSSISKSKIADVKKRLRAVQDSQATSSLLNLSSSSTDVIYLDAIMELVKLDRRVFSYYLSAAKLSRRCFGKLEEINTKLKQGKLGKLMNSDGVSTYFARHILFIDSEELQHDALDRCLSNKYSVLQVKMSCRTSSILSCEHGKASVTELRQLNEKIRRLEDEVRSLRKENREQRLTICKLNAELSVRRSEVWKAKRDAEEAQREADLARISIARMRETSHQATEIWFNMYEREKARSSALDVTSKDVEELEPVAPTKAPKTSEAIRFAEIIPTAEVVNEVVSPKRRKDRTAAEKELDLLQYLAKTNVVDRLRGESENNPAIDKNSETSVHSNSLQQKNTPSVGEPSNDKSEEIDFAVHSCALEEESASAINEEGSSDVDSHLWKFMEIKIGQWVAVAWQDKGFFIGRVTQMSPPEDVGALFLQYKADNVYEKNDRAEVELFSVQQILPSTPKLTARRSKRFVLENRGAIELDFLSFKRRVLK